MGTATLKGHYAFITICKDVNTQVTILLCNESIEIQKHSNIVKFLLQKQPRFILFLLIPGPVVPQNTYRDFFVLSMNNLLLVITCALYVHELMCYDGLIVYNCTQVIGTYLPVRRLSYTRTVLERCSLIRQGFGSMGD